MAPISTIFYRNRSRRPELNFRKIFRAVVAAVAVFVVVVVVVVVVVGVGGMAEPFKFWTS